MRKIVILLGLPGSGKGTHSRVISSQLSMPIISTGDILRKIAEEKNEYSDLLRSLMNQGKLIPDDLMNKVVRKHLLSDEYKEGCILDGYPRTVSQAEYLIENIECNIFLIFFDISEKDVKKRILGRYSCFSCGALYNKHSYKTKQDGVCDVCGSSDFVVRSDDNEEVFEERLNRYNNDTIPLINYYRTQNNFFVVDAAVTKTEVGDQVLEIIKKI